MRTVSSDDGRLVCLEHLRCYQTNRLQLSKHYRVALPIHAEPATLGGLPPCSRSREATAGNQNVLSGDTFLAPPQKQLLTCFDTTNSKKQKIVQQIFRFLVVENARNDSKKKFFSTFKW